MSNKVRFFFRILRFTLLFLVLNFGPWVYVAYVQEDQEADIGADTTQIISMDFKDAGLKDILKAFSIQSGLNFIASQEIEDYRITLYLDRVPVKEAMDKLLMANKLGYDFFEDSKIILVKKAEEEVEPTITKLILLKNARVSGSPINGEMEDMLGREGGEDGDVGITAVIAKLLSSRGSVVEDTRTNALIITDLPDKLTMIEETIKELDAPSPQVSLEVEMLDVSKNLVDKLGFDFGEHPLTLVLPNKFLRSGGRFFLGDDLDKKGISIDHANSLAQGSVILGNKFGALLDFLKEQSDTRYLARPRILTLNNETAEIKIATDEVIGEELSYDDQGNVSTRSAERTETGVSLRITPQVNMETGEITMFLSPKVVEAATSSFSSSYRDPEERVTNSLVRVRDGETVVIGGLIRNITYVTEKKIPLLGDMPILGLFFRHKYKSKDKERELLVFITPHIVKEAIAPLAKDGRVILSSREQDISGRLFQIESTLNNFNSAQY